MTIYLLLLNSFTAMYFSFKCFGRMYVSPVPKGLNTQSPKLTKNTKCACYRWLLTTHNYQRMLVLLKYIVF